MSPPGSEPSGCPDGDHNDVVSAIAVPVLHDREALLAVRRLVVRFGLLRVLDGVNLEIRPGEVVALAGENGAGKTTLVRCIAGALAPTHGEIDLFGRPIAADPAAVASQGVAVVWQDLALCENLDVAANLLLGRERRFLLPSETRGHAEAAALLARLGIQLRDTSRSVRTLSGGQRQLVAVARAMRDRPRLLVLDEPTAALGVSESAEVEKLILSLRDEGTTTLLISHDVEQMYRLADRIVVMRGGRTVGDVDPARTHPEEVVALISGQEVDSTARRQLSRLQGLVDQLASADRSSTLPLILSTLGAALGVEQLAIHRLDGERLSCVASLGLAQPLLSAWAELTRGPDGGPVGLAAWSVEAVLDENAATSPTWASFPGLAGRARIGSSWAVPILGSAGPIGVISVFRPFPGRPQRDELDLITLYAGYAASALERDRLFGEVTARNGVLETIREVLETLAGPVPVPEGLEASLRALRQELEAEEAALFTAGRDGEAVCRTLVRAGKGAEDLSASPVALEVGRKLLGSPALDGTVQEMTAGAGVCLAVGFHSPAGRSVLLARWSASSAPEVAPALVADGAHSFRLALEREAAGIIQQEAAALRRSRQLQRGFLSRLSHELRTPLTAIQGYAETLLQPDVTWDDDSVTRFLSRMAEESARLGRLVEDLLDFSAIESGVLRLHEDWCELSLVLDAARSCLVPRQAAWVQLSCEGLPAIWADHDRLEQVFVNLMDNAIRHNPVGTTVQITASGSDEVVEVLVEDDGRGLPPELFAAPLEAWHRASPSAGTGLGLSIAKAIVAAHGGSIHLLPAEVGTRFLIRLPIEGAGRRASEPVDA
ncbi:MAG: D-xylose transport ATP-binding protein XylG [Acidimicrobiaceae bacterium]|nr:D-xylose transport ATP-binding protein XylG [Acidimicrobiaceae bacterium]